MFTTQTLQLSFVFAGADWSGAIVIEPWMSRHLPTTYSCLSDVPAADMLGILYEVGDPELCGGDGAEGGAAGSTSCKIVLASFPAAFGEDRHVKTDDDDLTLVAAGRPVAAVVLPHKPGLVEHTAAKEFTRLVLKMSGAQLPIINASVLQSAAGSDDQFQTLVVIASCNSTAGGSSGFVDAPSLGLPAETTLLRAEGFAVRSVPGQRSLTISGDDLCTTLPGASPTSNGDCRYGTLFGVHALMRQLFGCEWLFPGDSAAGPPPTPRVSSARWFHRGLPSPCLQA